MKLLLAQRSDRHATVAFTPKGGCPLKREKYCSSARTRHPVAFTPKGGCPLKRSVASGSQAACRCSIHPQGWVPVETVVRRSGMDSHPPVAFTPKGGCPLKPSVCVINRLGKLVVAFTPKGGCPLKPSAAMYSSAGPTRSIHPQGWVLAEVGGTADEPPFAPTRGWVDGGRTTVRPYKRLGGRRANRRSPLQVCIHHKRGRVAIDCPPHRDIRGTETRARWVHPLLPPAPLPQRGRGA